MSGKTEQSEPGHARRISPTSIRMALVVEVAFLLFASSSRAQSPQAQPNYKLCLPATTSTPPNIDSADPNDPGWTGAFQYSLLTPAGTPISVVARGIKDGANNLYLSIDAGNLDATITDPANDYASTLVVLAFDPGDASGEAHMQRLHVFPVRPNAAYGSPVVAAQQVDYWGYGWNSTTGVWNGPVGHDSTTGSPPWLANNFKVRYYQAAGVYHWYLAMKIPTQATANPVGTTQTDDEVQIPTTGSFGLYIDVFTVKNGSLGHVYWPASWPPDSPESTCTGNTPVSNCTPDTRTPAPTAWGTSPLASNGCGGVSIGSQTNDISTNNFPNSKICIQPNVSVATGPDQFSCPANPNIFSATVHNSMIDGSGGGQTANGVRATFFITDWGITNSWIQIGVGGNPTAFLPVSPGDSTPFHTSAWSIPIPPAPSPNTRDFDPLFQFATPPSHPHQCVKVQLDSASGSNAVFLNSVAQQNMDFVNASKFQRNADISAKGYPPRLKPDGTAESDQLFDLRVTMRQEVLDSATSKAGSNLPETNSSRDKEGRVVSQLTWVLEGCRHTGRYMAIKNHKLEICEPVGAFGYVARHVGNSPVQEWRVRLTGIGLEPPTGNAYPLHISQDGVATVNTSINPTENRWAVFFDAGAGIPHGTFGSAFNTGFSLNTGLEYLLTSYASVEGIFGYHHFPGTITSDLNVYQFSANAKLYWRTYTWGGHPVRLFVNFGPGGYKFGSGSTYGGGNVGAGLLYEFRPTIGLQGSYNLHAFNGPAGATEFSTFQGGIRFVF